MAGRIPQHFINELLDRTDIVDIIDSRVPLKRAGRNHQGLCPFHQEKSPSFSVSPDKQFYYCFGCGAGGNAIGFLMAYDHLEFRGAVEDLAKRCGLSIPEEASIDPRIEKKRKNLYDQLSKAQHFYQQQLKTHADRMTAVDYLKNRGLTGEIAKEFAIGYAPSGWRNLGDELAKTPENEQQLQDAGLLIESDKGKKSYDRFRDRIIFPIRDTRGRAIAFGGRVFQESTAQSKSGGSGPKYLNSPESDVFHKGNELYGLFEANRAGSPKRFVIVEGYMDVVALAQHGIRYAVATLGTASSAAHLKKLFKRVPEIIFCFDGDAAGRRAALRALDNALPLMEDGRQIRFLFLPEGEDPDSMVHKEGREAFEQLLSASQSLPDYFFEHIGTQADTQSLDGCARFSRLALEKIALMPKGILHQLMLDKLAQITGLSAQALEQSEPQIDEPPPHYDERDIPPPPESDDWGQPSEPYPSNSMGSRSNTKNNTRSNNKAANFQRKAKAPRLGVLPPAKRAFVYLLHQPALFKETGNLETLATVQAPGIELLIELTSILSEDTSLKMGQIYGRIQTSPNFEEMKRLFDSEHLLGDMDIREEFVGTLHRLRITGLEQAIDQLLENSKSRALSATEKSKYAALQGELTSLKALPSSPP